MAAIRWELEDLAFKFWSLGTTQRLLRASPATSSSRAANRNMKGPLEEALTGAGINAEVEGRPKHLWSIHRKIESQGRPFEEIYDLMAMRITTESIQDCYAAPVSSIAAGLRFGTLRLYSDPKSNMYRSLHTTVLGPEVCGMKSRFALRRCTARQNMG